MSYNAEETKVCERIYVNLILKGSLLYLVRFIYGLFCVRLGLTVFQDLRYSSMIHSLKKNLNKCL